MPFLRPFTEHIYGLLRIVAGALFFFHGAQKLFGWPGDKPPVVLASLMGAAGVIELVAGGLICLGLFTPVAAFIASGEMAFAYFLRHAPNSFFPIVNRGEVVVLYCFLFLYFAARGSGILSVDALRHGTRRR